MKVDAIGEGESNCGEGREREMGGSAKASAGCSFSCLTLTDVLRVKNRRDKTKPRKETGEQESEKGVLSKTRRRWETGV